MRIAVTVDESAQLGVCGCVPRCKLKIPYCFSQYCVCECLSSKNKIDCQNFSIFEALLSEMTFQDGPQAHLSPLDDHESFIVDRCLAQGCAIFESPDHMAGVLGLPLFTVATRWGQWMSDTRLREQDYFALELKKLGLVNNHQDSWLTRVPGLSQTAKLVSGTFGLVSGTVNWTFTRAAAWGVPGASYIVNAPRQLSQQPSIESTPESSDSAPTTTEPMRYIFAPALHAMAEKLISKHHRSSLYCRVMSMEEWDETVLHSTVRCGKEVTEYLVLNHRDRFEFMTVDDTQRGGAGSSEHGVWICRDAQELLEDARRVLSFKVMCENVGDAIARWEDELLSLRRAVLDDPFSNETESRLKRAASLRGALDGTTVFLSYVDKVHERLALPNKTSEDVRQEIEKVYDVFGTQWPPAVEEAHQPMPIESLTALPSSQSTQELQSAAQSLSV